MKRHRQIVLPALALAFGLGAASCEGTGPVEKSDVPRVVKKLETGSASGRKAAEERLYETDPQLHWELVLPIVDRKSASVDARAAAIRVIGHTCGRNGIPLKVLNAAADPEPVLRHEASRAMVAWGDPAMIKPLEQLEKAATDPAIKKDLGDLIANLQKGKTAWYRRQIFAAQDAMDRAMAARWLAEIGGEEDVPELIRATQETGEGLLRQECILALGRIGGERAATFLRGLLVSDNGYTRGAAAIAEIALKDPLAIPHLKKIIADDKIGDIRISAATALGAIGNAEAKAALEESCPLGEPDKRLQVACADAQKKIAQGS